MTLWAYVTYKEAWFFIVLESGESSIEGSASGEGLLALSSYESRWERGEDT